MIKVKTRLLGELEISEESCFVFPEGILGFPESNKFALIDIPRNEFFYLLQDVEEEFISFIITDPFKVYCDYEVDISDEDLIKIKIEKKEQVGVMAMVTMAKPFKDSTLNLLAPIILNLDKKLGRQYVLNDMNYKTKHPLFVKKEGDDNAYSAAKA